MALPASILSKFKLPPTTATGSTGVSDQIEQFSGKAARELIDLGEKSFNRAREQRVSFERQWYMNMAFYFGRHYAQWIGANTPGGFSRLHEPGAPPWRVRMVSNKIKPIIRAEMAKVLKERPQGFVVPATTDDNDIIAAQAADAILEHLFRERQVERVKRRAAFWLAICGTSFIKDWYEAQTLDESGVPGKINLEPVTPLQLYAPDLQEEELDNQPFIIQAMAKDPAWVQRVYNKKVMPDSYAKEATLEQRFSSDMGLQNQSKQYVLVKEMWMKPTAKYPRGLMLTWCKDTLLHMQEEWPYGYQDYPFTKIDHIPTGRFYGESTIVDLIPLMREYNRTRSQLIESKNRMSKPQLIAPRGSVNPNQVTSEPGLIIQYTPGFQPPMPLELQGIPAYVTEEMERIASDMNDISAQHEISKGSTPPGVTAATAISYLQEEDDSKLAPTIASLEEAVERIGRHFLSHVKDFWTAERKIKVTGDNKSLESFVFTNSAIKGNTDFRIESGSATPRSKAAKQAFITELMKNEWIPPDRGLRYLDMGEVGRLYEETQIDARHAQRENMRMAAGVGSEPALPPMMGGDPNDPMAQLQMLGGGGAEMGGGPMDGMSGASPMPSMPPGASPDPMNPPPSDPMAQQQMGLPTAGGADPSMMQSGPPPVVGVNINSYDNHAIHIVEHQNYQKKQQYDVLPPERKQVFEKHIMMHRAVLLGEVTGETLPKPTESTPGQNIGMGVTGQLPADTLGGAASAGAGGGQSPPPSAPPGGSS